MKTLVVVNPNSANGATRRRWQKQRSAVSELMGPLEESWTRGPGHATELVREALIKGFERIITVGGDGTNNEAVNGFFDGSRPINRQAVLGLMPSGTGDDFRKSLTIGKHTRECLAVLAAGKTKPIDVGLARFYNHQGNETQRFFINVVSFGLGGRVDEKVNKSSKLLGGKFSFLIGSMKALIGFHAQPVHLTVRTHDQSWSLDETILITNVAAANGQYFGGGMLVAPGAKLDDGLFDLTIIGEMGKAKLILKTPKIYAGTHLELPEVSTLQGTHLEATSDEEVLIDMDGEQPGRLPMVLDMLPAAIRLIVP